MLNTRSNSDLLHIYTLLDNADFKSAENDLIVATEKYIVDEEISPVISFALHAVSFWKTVVPGFFDSNNFQNGEIVINEWDDFLSHMYSFFGSKENTHGEDFSECINHIKRGIFLFAFQCYQNIGFQRIEPNEQADIYRKLGLCQKKLCDYECSLSYLEKANSMEPKSAGILAEMADCYALCGEERLAKVLFREAFFIDAQKINVNYLESELILRLISIVKNAGYSGAALLEWVPVYGVLNGIFSIKRELSALEGCRLLQDINALKSELQEVGNEPGVLIPRLINRYFWLIDYYLMDKNADSKINREKVKGILLEIKVINEWVYQKYIS